MMLAVTAVHGFGIFALEANLPEAERVNDYTIRGEGDPKQLIRGMYVWPWMTDEMLNPENIHDTAPALCLGVTRSMTNVIPTARRDPEEAAVMALDSARDQ